MARRSREQIIKSIKRLGAILQLENDWAVAHPEYDGLTGTQRRNEDERISALLAAGMSPSELEKGYREAVNDVASYFFMADGDGDPEAQSFFGYYRQASGRHFWADAGNPAYAARAILSRGVIADTVEWRLLNDLISDVDQSVLKGSALNRALTLLAQFEAAAEGEED